MGIISRWLSVMIEVYLVEEYRYDICKRINKSIDAFDIPAETHC